MATTTVSFQHPFPSSIYWEHRPTNGTWQDAANLSGYAGGQGTKTLEITSVTGAEIGYVKVTITTPDGKNAGSRQAVLTGEDTGTLTFTSHPTNKTISPTNTLNFTSHPSNKTISAT